MAGKEESIESEIDLRDVPNKQEQQQQQKKAADNEPDDIDLEIVDDTPPEDRNRPKRDQKAKSAIPEDDEIGQYTKGVQERLKQMKWEYHEERRAKEQFQREHQVALDMTKQIYAENQKLRKALEDGHKTMLGSNKTALESEVTALQGSLAAAMNAGESDKVAKLQADLAKAAARLVGVEQTQPIKFEQPDQQTQQQDRQRQEQQIQAPRLTRPMQEWMDDNPWFNGTDSTSKRMTAYAFGIHDDLVNGQKVVPESPAYFKAINDEMKERFPEYWGEQQQNNKGTGNGNTSQSQRRTVGGASRLNGSGGTNDRGQKTKVTLTQSELAVAKRIGVSAEQYAREKLRLENSNG